MTNERHLAEIIFDAGGWYGVVSRLALLARWFEDADNAEMVSLFRAALHLHSASNGDEHFAEAALASGLADRSADELMSVCDAMKAIGQSEVRAAQRMMAQARGEG